MSDIINFLLLHSFLVDCGFLLAGIAVSRLPQFAVFLRVAILLARIALWYFKTHPTGKKQASQTHYDEQLQHIYTTHLKAHDPHPETEQESCLGKGSA